MALQKTYPTDQSAKTNLLKDAINPIPNKQCQVDLRKSSNTAKDDKGVIALQLGDWFLGIWLADSQQKLLHVCLDTDVVKLEICGPEPMKPVYLTDITDVRYGWQTDTFSRIARNKDLQTSARLKEDRCFSIIYGPQRQTINLQAKDSNIAQSWVANISSLVSRIRSRSSRSDKSAWLKRQFKEADIDHSGFLNFDECCRLLNNLNVTLQREKAEKLFQLSNTNHQLEKGEDVLDENEFLCFYNLVSERAELNSLFHDFARGDASLSAYSLIKFLREEQEMKNVDIDYAQTLIECYKLQKGHSDMRKMNLLEFQSMMNSPMFDILKEEHRQVNQDMNQPLSNYYISSSHNTYLVGDQLVGVSSIEGYVSALERGCRCLELDLWDGSDGQPIIYHGYTKTSKLLARDVLAKGIKPFAFKYSPFPLILSVENHLSPTQEAIFAKDLQEIFGSTLSGPEEVAVGTESSPFSPNQLQGKIIIKATGVKICCPTLQKLVNVCQSIPNFEKFDDEKVKRNVNSYCVVSMSELEASAYLKKLVKESTKNHGRRAMIRVYPTATRMGSSNFSPVHYWNFGCQMVALNFQTFDKNLEINAGRFRRNGNCGYVLKPDWLLDKIGRFPFPCKPRKLLKLRIISGQNLPRRPCQTKKGNFYVSVKIEGHPRDSYKFRTNYLNGNGLNPYWNEQTEAKIFVPELAVICFSVKFVDIFKIKQTVASYCLPIESLASGYRHAPLSSTDLVSSIFLSVKVFEL